MTITKERLLKIQHWRETYGADSNVMLPAEEAEELARIALAALEAEPIGAFHIADQQVGGTSDYIKDGEWPIDNGVIEVYAAQPASERERIRHEHAEWSYADPVVFTDERNLRHIASGRETSLIWGKQNQEVGDIPLYRHAQPVPVDKEFIPKNLDKALGVVGVALPESKEEFNFQIERWIQRLIDRVIRYADEFKEQPAPVVPDERAAFNAWNNEDNLPIAGVGAKNAAWLAWQARASLCGNSALNVPPERPADSSNGDDVEAWFDEGWNACRAAMLNGGKS